VQKVCYHIEMTPKELYTRTPERIDNNVNRLYGCYFNHVPEIRAVPYCGDFLEDKAKRIEIHYFKDFCFDGRRTWTLAGVKFDGEFIMIIQNAGREGDDYTERFITNKDGYPDMVAYIASLIPPDDLTDQSYADYIGEDEDLDKLDTFYGNTLDGYFERY